MHFDSVICYITQIIYYVLQYKTRWWLYDGGVVTRQIFADFRSSFKLGWKTCVTNCIVFFSVHNVAWWFCS